MKLSLRARIGFILLMALFVMINLLGFSKETRNLFYSVSAPVQTFLWQKGQETANFFEIFLGLKRLKEERDSCQAEREELLTEQALKQSLEKENKTLRQALGIGLQEDFQLLLVRSLSFDAHNDTLFIDKGERAGLSEGQPVITAERVLVGKVSEVYARSAKVILLSHPESSLTGKILGKEITGLVQGKGQLRFVLEELPKDEEVLRGEVVVSSAPAKIYPADLLLGEVSRVERSDIVPFQRAHLSPFFDPRALSHLFVLKDF